MPQRLREFMSSGGKEASPIAQVEIVNRLAPLGVYIKWATIHNVRVYPSEESEGAMKIINDAVNEVKATLTLDGLKHHPVIRAYRDFYWQLGVDPTKTRPSAEALIRRVLRNAQIPLINNVVDMGNVVSVKTMIPIGIYDLDKLAFPLTLRRAQQDEVFYPIGGEPEKLTGRNVVLADSANTIIHVFPHRDSSLTRVVENTRHLLVVACGVKGVEEVKVQEAVDLASNLIARTSQLGGEQCGHR